MKKVTTPSAEVVDFGQVYGLHDLTIEQVMMKSIKSRGGLTSGRGLTETVCLQWVYSMHKCAAIHSSMTTLTGLNHHTSDQHVDLGTSRSNRDFYDLNSIQQWFDQHEPFDLTEERLRSLSSGLRAADDDHINCDKVEEIGAKIQEKLDGLRIPDASIKRNNHIQSLNHLYPAIQIDKQKIHFNPCILLHDSVLFCIEKRILSHSLITNLQLYLLLCSKTVTCENL